MQSAKLPCHILSNGQDELRILVEKKEYEAKSCFFTLARSSSLGLIFQEMTR